jgi:hypothetical protein
MTRWFIVGLDWKTPLKKQSGELEGQGEGKDTKAACAGVKAWIEANLPRYKDWPYWRFVKLADGSGTIIDFGSHTVFARLEGEE